MKRRHDKINEVSKNLAEEAFKCYSGKKDYKRALQIYMTLAESECVPDDISSFSKSMLARLSKKIDDTM